MGDSSPSGLRSHAAREPEARDDHAQLQFARGWALGPSATPWPVGVVPVEWGRVALAGDRVLRWDRRLECIEAVAGPVSVVIIGHAIDLRADTSDMSEIAAGLLQARLAGRSAYIDALAWLCGRYVVVDCDGGPPRVQADAVGMRSIYYHAERRIVASHQNLVAELSGVDSLSVFGTPEWRRANHAVCYPGSETAWQGVKFLTANHELDLDSMRPSRVSLAAPERLSTTEVADRVLELTRRQLPHLLRRPGRPVISLTAGQDSRSTLAVVRPVRNEFRYFTYALMYSPRKRAVRLDVEGSRAVARVGRLRDHHVYRLDGPIRDDTLRAVLERNSVKRSMPNVAELYLREMSDAGMHIRSSFNEVGVAGYRAKLGDIEVTPEVLADLLTYQKGYTPDTLAAVTEYFDATGIARVPHHDPLDLWYWETRMGSWLGTILNESDIAFDTHILIGSREIVRLLLSAPLAERSRIGTYDALISSAWPELYDVPVNGRKRGLIAR